jgi:hypothetical protein
MMIGCSEENIGEKVRVRINHYQQPTTSEGSFLTFVVQEDDKIGSSQWTTRWPDIKGFKYEKGFVYDIIVRDKKRDELIMDAPDIETTLVKVISKKKIPPQTAFEMMLAFAVGDQYYVSYVGGNLSDGFHIVSSLPIDCDTLCDELAQRLESKQSITGVFYHTDTGVKLIGFK